ncbi:MAG: hypothetical protein OZ923_02370 [Comamonadaceae bacterium]|nr:hypothetical protein [Burkholderiales bacterium]MEB2347435.1 hypothetical protein [Comamonadaceae bacterium]
MPFLTAINHLLNFLAPALVVALLLVATSHVFMRKLAQPRGWLAPIALLFVVGCAVLALGVALLGSDGRMLTYTALVLVCASVRWVELRAWR